MTSTVRQRIDVLDREIMRRRKLARPRDRTMRAVRERERDIATLADIRDDLAGWLTSCSPGNSEDFDRLARLLHGETVE
jgi:hypothetical protein